MGKIKRDEETLFRLQDVCSALEELHEHLDYDEDDMQISITSELKTLEKVDRYRGLYSRYIAMRKNLMKTLADISNLAGILEDKQDALERDGV